MDASHGRRDGLGVLVQRAENLFCAFVGRLGQRVDLGEQFVDVARTGFDDPRLEELLFRYRARNFPDTLTEEEQQQWQQHCAARLHDGAGGAFTLDAFFERVEALEPEADDRGQDILGALVDYATEIAPDR